MSRLEQLEDQVQTLSRDELEEFRLWFAAYDAVQWDGELEIHATDGTLARLAKKSLADHGAGRSTRL